MLPAIPFFNALKLNTQFLNQPPANWNSCSDYKKAKEVVKSLQVVNDAAERGIALISTFNDILTNKEDQKQYLLQLVEKHRNDFPNANKSTIITVLSQSHSM